MTRHLCYFAPNGEDPAVHRRIAQLSRAGMTVTGFTFTRDAAHRPRPFDGVDLGYLRHRSYGRRALVLAGAVLRLWRHRDAVRRASVLQARNLDNALLALIGRALAGSRAPLIYEVLDIRPAFLDPGLRGGLLRWLERCVLDRAAVLTVSAPRFREAYFGPVQGYGGPWHLLENKISANTPLTAAARPTQVAAARTPGGPPWRLGWFGYIDDAATWAVLRHVAQALPDRVQVVVRGIVYGEMDEVTFRREVDALPNVTYGGPFLNPEDLPALMGGVDLVWCDDLGAAGGNSDWLLPNVLYDAGYFAKPMIARRAAPSGERIARLGIGWALNGPPARTLEALLRTLSPAAWEARRGALESLPAESFVETDDVATLLAAVLPPRNTTTQTALAPRWRQAP